MKIIFVDAENIGLKELKKIDASVLDKVFVFSKSEPIKAFCEKYLYLYLSDYPSGSNQADFYIIAYLSRILSAIDKKKMDSFCFELISDDESLISAFTFQCTQLGGRHKITRTKASNVVPISITSDIEASQKKLHASLVSPKVLGPELQRQLGLSKSTFSKAINELTKNNKIKRSPESKRKWIQC